MSNTIHTSGSVAAWIADEQARDLPASAFRAQNGHLPARSRDPQNPDDAEYMLAHEYEFAEDELHQARIALNAASEPQSYTYRGIE